MYRDSIFPKSISLHPDRGNKNIVYILICKEECKLCELPLTRDRLANNIYNICNRQSKCIIRCGPGETCSVFQFSSRMHEVFGWIRPTLECVCTNNAIERKLQGFHLVLLRLMDFCLNKYDTIFKPEIMFSLKFTNRKRCHLSSDVVQGTFSIELKCVFGTSIPKSKPDSRNFLELACDVHIFCMLSSD